MSVRRDKQSVARAAQAQADAIRAQEQPTPLGEPHVVDEAYTRLAALDAHIRRTDTLALIAAAVCVIAAAVMVAFGDGLYDPLGIFLAALSGGLSGITLTHRRIRTKQLDALRAMLEDS